jgi:hypothetical protein
MKVAIRQGIGRMLMAAIVFAQISVAAYACPGQPKLDAAAIIETVSADMPGDCNHMTRALDRDAPNLCAAHCHNDEQSSNHAAVPDLPPGLFSTLYWLTAATPATCPHSAPCDLVLHAALSPPHAILHCCFRI